MVSENLSRVVVQHHLLAIWPVRLACHTTWPPRFCLHKWLPWGSCLCKWNKVSLQLRRTIVLQKPNKPCYKKPKVYWPITLILTMAKVLPSTVSENLSRVVVQHHLLPRNHFGGRPGCSTVDAVQYLVHRISKAWRECKVVSVIFLNVEGAFANAVTAKIIHNLKKSRHLIIKFAYPVQFLQFLHPLDRTGL